jgi:hypothetical protein
MLEPNYWSIERIGESPVFPIILITLDDDGGMIDYYPSIGNFEVRYNHMLYENIFEGFYPYMIDQKLNLFELKFHEDRFIYPGKIGTIDKSGILDLLEKCKILEINKFAEMNSEKEILSELTKRNFKYHWEQNY